MKLDHRIKELIAVGTSVSANCQPFLQYHASETRKNGADNQDIIKAIDVGKMVRRGAAAKMDKFAASLTPTAAQRTTQ